MKKKVLMSLLLLIAIGTSVIWAQQPTLEKLTLANQTTNYAVKAANNSISGAVVIPGTHEGKPVVFAYSAFQNITGITSVVILNGVTRLNQNVFRGCTGLTSVTIPGSVTDIGQHAFSGCTSLTTVNLATGVANIGVSMFTGCTSLRSITIPASVGNIGNNAFTDCTNLTSVTFQGTPPSTGRFGTNAFPGDLRTKYMAGGPGVYTRTAGSNTWTRTGNAPVAPPPPPVVNTSIEGIWIIGTTQISVSGNAGVFSNMGTLGGRQLDAFNKGYIKVGDQFWRNLRSTGNLTWSGQHLVVTANDRTPNVAIGTDWANATFTMSADGLTLTTTSTVAGTGTYTRR